MQLPHPKILKKLHGISISNEIRLDHQVKTNSRTMTKLSIDPLYVSPKAGVRRRKMIISKKLISIFQQEKLLSSLISSDFSMTALEMYFIVSKLKHLKNLTSLALQYLCFCTPQLLKHLSVTLHHLKKLTSLTLNVPSEINMTPKHVTSLFFALRSLDNLTSFSLILNRTTFGEKSYQLLTSCLSKLIHLKSFTLSLINARNLSASFLSALAPSFKKLLSLQNLNINLSYNGSIESQAIIDFFASIKALKSLKSLAFNFRNCLINMADSQPISKGLSLLDPDLLQSFDFGSHSNLDDESLQELGIALQRFTSLRELALDFTDNHTVSNIGLYQLVSSLQTLDMLSSLYLGFLSASNMTGPVGIIAPAIKPLVRLRSLYIDFTGYNLSHDLQLCLFSESLQGLTALKNLTLKFGQLGNIKDEGLMDFAAALKSLTELSTLTLDLSYLAKLTNKAIISLASVIGNLNKLTELSIDFLWNQNLDKESTDSLGEALQNLLSLTAISLNFKSCLSLKGDGDKFLVIFKALGEMKFLKKIHMTLPSKNYNEKDYQLYTRNVPDNTISWS